MGSAIYSGNGCALSLVSMRHRSIAALAEIRTSAGGCGAVRTMRLLRYDRWHNDALRVVGSRSKDKCEECW